jgi:hypothetical protein
MAETHPDLVRGDAFGWKEIEAVLADTISDIQVRMINGTAKDALDYADHDGAGLKVIAIGGDKLAENLGIARKALDQFGTPELKDVLNMTGFGNHPAVIRAFYKIGKAISEDKFVKGSTPSAAATDIAKRMFPTMN